MTEERWEDIKKIVAEKFDQQEVLREDFAEGGYSESVQFVSPMGRVELEFVHKPKLLTTTTLYSNRIGSQVKIENVYSQDEFVNMLKAYKYDESTDSWKSMESAGFWDM